MPDLVTGTQQGRLVVDNGAPPLDGKSLTLTEVVKSPPAPALAAVYPASIVKSGPNVLMHCFGGGFDRESRIVINNNVERTSYVSPGEVTTWIDGALWTGADPAVPIKVRTQNGDTPGKTFAVV